MNDTVIRLRAGLITCRKIRKLSQTALARKTGLHPSAISHFETGRRTPTIFNLLKIADALSMTLDQLVGRRWK